jgi:hypothetical protein
MIVSSEMSGTVPNENAVEFSAQKSQWFVEMNGVD